VVSAVRMDLGRERAVGMGAVSLRPLGLLQQLLGLVTAQQLLQEAQLVAPGAGSIQLLIRQRRLLVSVVVLPA